VPTLFEEIIKLLSNRALISLYHSLRYTIFEFEVIAEIGSILIKDPLRLRLTALIVITWLVVAAVEAAAKVRPAQRAGVFPSYCFGNINFILAFVAYCHKEEDLLVAIFYCKSPQDRDSRSISRINIAKFRLSVQRIQ
jgi:hypothetical protein